MKVGDKVICIDDKMSDFVILGKIYTISKIHSGRYENGKIDGLEMLGNYGCSRANRFKLYSKKNTPRIAI